MAASGDDSSEPASVEPDSLRNEPEPSAPPPPSDERPPPAQVFQLGPRAHWHPSVSSLFVAFVGLVPALILGFLLRPIHPLVGIALGLSFAVVAAVWPQVTLTVGVDGVAVNRRFIGYDRITGVGRGEDYGRGVVGLTIALAGGERVQLFAMVRDRETILARIVEARDRFHRLRRDLDMGALQKRDRTPAEWVRDLRAIGSGGRLDHRTPPVPPESLWQAVESAGAEPGVRAAAAVALRETIDLDGRRRLLELAETTASRRLRVALQAVAADRDDEALAEVLAAAEAAKAEPSGTRTRRA